MTAPTPAAGYYAKAGSGTAQYFDGEKWADQFEPTGSAATGQSQRRRRLPRLGIGCGIALSILAGILLSTLLTTYFAWVPTHMPLWSLAWFGAVKGPAWFDAVRAAITAVGAFGVLGVAYVAYRRQRSIEAQRDDAVERALHERFAEAAKLLGEERAVARLCGVYAFDALARDWGDSSNGRLAVIALLRAYLNADTLPSADEHGGRPRVLEEQVRTSTAEVLHGLGCS